MRVRNFKCEIEMENAAFDDDTNGRGELAKILGELAIRLRQGLNGELALRDTNGNRVGYAKIYRKEVK